MMMKWVEVWIWIINQIIFYRIFILSIFIAMIIVEIVFQFVSKEWVLNLSESKSKIKKYLTNKWIIITITITVCNQYNYTWIRILNFIIYIRGRQPFVVGGPKNGKIINLFLLRAINSYFFSHFFQIFLTTFFLLLRI